MRKEIAKLADETASKVTELRRGLHQSPETSGNEEKTAALVAATLRELGIPYREKVGGYGVVGLVTGELPGPTVAIRADMDALALQDLKDAPYASKVPGAAHACGHDAHTAILLGVATVLSQLRGRLPGSVKLIFQPAEESIAGAERMIAEGAMDNPPVSAIIALHCYPSFPCGQVGLRPGPAWAASDSFDFTIAGRGGHAARPHETVDALLVAAQAVSAIHQIVSRRVNPLHPAVITLGTINGGTARNIVADRVTVAGTMRSLTPAVRETLMKALEQTLDGVCRVNGASYQFNYRENTPAVVNDPVVTGAVAESLREVLGHEAVKIMEEPAMGSEDFACYLERAPGCIFRLGTGGDARFNYPLHHGCFDIDERALPVGVKTLAWAAVKLLQAGGQASGL